AFEGLQRSTRHKSGLAMRFPRISRLRWDKPPGEADRLEQLETMIAWAGAERLALDLTDSLAVAPRARWPLEEVTKRAGEGDGTLASSQ
ncbi:MAG: hypothetical protein WBD83_07930, partial [Xanthobacteraceae bacterium]